MNPRIAVITPSIPPRAKMLRRALFSVHAQTLPPAAHNIAYDINREGAPATRQRALDAVTSDIEWVAPLDDDDEFKPFHLEALYRHAQETGADMVYSWFELIGQGGQSYGDVDPIFPATHFTNPFNPDNPIETTITVLVRAELAKQVGYKRLNRGEANTGEDRYFTLECLAAGAKISHLVQRTWRWSHHGGNTSGLTTKGDWLR
jgi:hypothetical protein